MLPFMFYSVLTGLNILCYSTYVQLLPHGRARDFVGFFGIALIVGLLVSVLASLLAVKQKKFLIDGMDLVKMYLCSALTGCAAAFFISIQVLLHYNPDVQVTPQAIISVASREGFELLWSAMLLMLPVSFLMWVTHRVSQYIVYANSSPLQSSERS